MSIKKEINEVLENTINHMRHYGINKKIFFYQKLFIEPVEGLPSFQELTHVQNLIKNSFDYKHVKHFLVNGDSFLKLDVTLQNQKPGLLEESFLKSEDLGYFVLRKNLPLQAVDKYESAVKQYFNRL